MDIREQNGIQEEAKSTSSITFRQGDSKGELRNQQWSTDYVYLNKEKKKVNCLS